jgi:hypothetical protein
MLISIDLDGNLCTWPLPLSSRISLKQSLPELLVKDKEFVELSSSIAIKTAESVFFSQKNSTKNSESNHERVFLLMHRLLVDDLHPFIVCGVLFCLFFFISLLYVYKTYFVSSSNVLIVFETHPNSPVSENNPLLMFDSVSEMLMKKSGSKKTFTRNSFKTKVSLKNFFSPTSSSSFFSPESSSSYISTVPSSYQAFIHIFNIYANTFMFHIPIPSSPSAFQIDTHFKRMLIAYSQSSLIFSKKNHSV